MTDLLDRYWKLVVIWVLSLIAVGSISSVAQVRSRGFDPPLQLPTILSGNDVGFRVDRTQDGIPVGTLVVRIDGVWVAPESSPRGSATPR